MGTISYLSDKLSNLVSRLGTSADKASYDAYYGPVWHNQAEIDAAYRTSLFRKIVHIPVDDALSSGVTWQADDARAEKIDAELKRLRFWQKIHECMILARKDGEAAIYMGGLPGRPDAPARPGSIKFLTVLRRWQFTPKELVRNIESDQFGEPIAYMVNSDNGPVEVHPSRLVKMIGAKVFDQNSDGRGDSLWTVLREGMKNSDVISSSVASLMHEVKVDVIAVEGFAANVATQEYQDAQMRRWALFQLLKSTNNIAIIDKNDEWEQKTFNFAGIPDVWDRAMLVVSALADIPQTRLYGRAPQGMNSTGKSDEANYWKQIATRQEMEIRPLIAPIVVGVLMAAGAPADTDYTWNELDEIGEKEAAEIEKIYAEGLASRVNTGLFDDQVLAKAELGRMVESGQYSALEDAIAESDIDGVTDPDEVEAKEIERMEREAQIAAANAPRPNANPV